MKWFNNCAQSKGGHLVAKCRRSNQGRVEMILAAEGHSVEALVVGQPFSDRKTWPNNFVGLYYSVGVSTLVVGLRQPTQKEVDGMATGKIRFAIHAEENVIYFCFAIEDCMDWSDMAFTIRLLPEEEQIVSDAENVYVPLSMVLIDADTGIIKALRVVTMSATFANFFKKKLREQITAPFSREQHFATVERLNKKYPTSKHIVRAAVIRELAGKTI